MHNKTGFIGQLFSTIGRAWAHAAPWPRYFRIFPALQVFSNLENSDLLERIDQAGVFN